MGWDEVAPSGRTAEVTRALQRAARDAYDDNVLRHSPLDLGDSPLMFGQAITTNARHLAADALEAIDGVEVLDAGRLWSVQLQADTEQVRVYLYKAPPAAASIRDLVLRSQTLRSGLLTAAPDQLRIPIDGEPDRVPRHVVVAMFGDAVNGLERLEAGEPMLSAGAAGGYRLDWVWHEVLQDDSYGGRVQQVAVTKPDHDDEERFDVTLRVVPDVAEGGR
jgi:hypothetical protein